MLNLQNLVQLKYLIYIFKKVRAYNSHLIFSYLRFYKIYWIADLYRY